MRLRFTPLLRRSLPQLSDAAVARIEQGMQRELEHAEGARPVASFWLGAALAAAIVCAITGWSLYLSARSATPDTLPHGSATAQDPQPGHEHAAPPSSALDHAQRHGPTAAPPRNRIDAVHPSPQIRPPDHAAPIRLVFIAWLASPSLRRRPALQRCGEGPSIIMIGRRMAPATCHRASGEPAFAGVSDLAPSREHAL